jgi:uncharacterized protein (TIGR02284 family)
MKTTHTNAVRALRHLYKIVEAGEKGYAVAALSVKNRGLKLLFKSYAQKRLEYKQELLAELQRLGSHTKPRGSLLGAIHRGRITIFAAMTIGEENIERVVLKEVVLGDGVARRTYERTLEQNLPDATHELVRRQHEEVRQVVEKVQRMRGKNGVRLMVRLYNTDRDADRAVRKLMESGSSPESIQRLVLTPIQIYLGRGTNTIETVLSGAVGGAVWGSVAGTLAAAGIVQAARSGVGVMDVLTLPQVLVASVLGLIAAGIFIGGSIGFFIGLGIKDEDDYLYNESTQHGRVLVQVLTDASRASPVWRLLARVNIEARAGVAAQKS